MNKLIPMIVQKTVLPALAVGVFLLALVAFVEGGLNAIGGLTTAAIDVNAERTVLALGALDNINLATIKEKNTLLEKGDEAVAKNIGEYGELMSSATQKLDQLKTIADTGTISVLNQVSDLTVQYRKLTEESVFPLVKQGNLAKATEISFDASQGGGRELRQKIRAELENVVGVNRNEMRAFGLAVKTESARTINILALIAACGSALALVWVSVVQIMGAGKKKLGGKLDMEIDEAGREEEKAAVISALEMFKANASKARHQAEEEEKEYERKLNELKKDSD